MINIYNVSDTLNRNTSLNLIQIILIAMSSPDGVCHKGHCSFHPYIT